MIRLYRLTSGEDVNGTPQESDIHGSVAIKKPFVLIPMAQNPGSSAETKLYFSPFIPFADNEEMNIKESNIIVINEAKPEIKENYLNYIGAIVPVEKKIIA